MLFSLIEYLQEKHFFSKAHLDTTTTSADPENSSPKAMSQEAISQEESHILNTVRQNIEHTQVTPPPNIIWQIKDQAGRQSTPQATNSASFRLKPAISFILLLAIAGPLFWFWHNHRGNNERIMISALGHVPSLLKPGTTLASLGLKMQTATEGLVAIDTTSLKKHIFLSKGSWKIQTEHQLLDKETWFHFPGGGLKPLGTEFTISIGKDTVNIFLKSGKIETYQINKDGNLKSSSVETAPYHEAISIQSLATQLIPYTAANQLTDMVNDKLDELIPSLLNNGSDRRQHSSVYKNFIGSYISVIIINQNAPKKPQDKPQKISGFLEAANDGKLRINDGTSVIEVDEKNLILIHLEFPESHVQDNVLKNLRPPIPENL